MRDRFRGVDWREGGDCSGRQDQMDARAPLASPALSGTPTAPTAAGGTNTTQMASTGCVGGEIIDTAAGLVDYSGSGPVWPLAVDRTGQALVWYDADADRVDFATDVIERKTQPALGVTIAAGTKVALFFYGQSNSTYSDADPAISTSQPYSNVMFVGGAVPGTDLDDAESTLSLYASFSPLVESAAESACSGAANYYRSLAAIEDGEDPDAVSVLAAARVRGGSAADGQSIGGAHESAAVRKGACAGWLVIDPD